MTAIDTRSLKRDSLFLTADLTLDDGGEPVRVKVRNLSDGGMMAEAPLSVERGMRLGIELRNIGPIKGSVAWTQDNRFGIVFDSEIDSKKVRAPAGTGEKTPRYVRPSTVLPATAHQVREGSIRKI
ncbi:MAG: PilZ domain-containing protein [Erythrobacter sp.]|nr:PilZ domain-containing protein [Erythrobacter sp.]NCQ65107.1 PilZ domain-containing protein [Alphaproteobacteria bacterium]